VAAAGVSAGDAVAPGTFRPPWSAGRGVRSRGSSRCPGTTSRTASGRSSPSGTHSCTPTLRAAFFAPSTSYRPPCIVFLGW